MAEQKEEQNPFDKSDEGNFNNWQHGFNSLDKDDCPYQDGMLEYDTAYPVWMAGYNAGAKLRRAKKKVEPEPAPQAPIKKGPGRPKQAATEPKATADGLTEEFLLEKLRELKRPQYEALKAEVAKLAWLFEE